MADTTSVIVLMGPMGCGKSTVGKILAAELDWPFYDGDDFHPPENVEKMRNAVPLNDMDRLPWLTILKNMIRSWLTSGQKAILACSALKESYREILGVNHEGILLVYLKGTKKILAGRLLDRNHPYMADDLLDSQLNTLEEPNCGMTVDISAEPEEIVEKIKKVIQSTDDP